VVTFFPGLRGYIRRYNRDVRIRALITFVALVTALASAQSTSDKTTPNNTPNNVPSTTPNNVPGNAGGAGESSSSRETRIDLSPPSDDAKRHPGSRAAVEDLEGSTNTSDVQEFHPWNPLKAKKDIEIGDFYFKRKNYKGALERYKEALYYKEGDALASFRLAVCQEKLGDKDEAKKYYAAYLKILPEGPFAKDAQASLNRLAKTQ
jgi:tetratricopeptide (TPR) repeat protein